MSLMKINLNSIKKFLPEDVSSLDFSPPKLKSFGFLFGTILLILSVYLYFIGSELSYFILVASLHFGGFALFAVRFLKIPYLIWMSFAIILGNIVSRIILFTIFFIIITPISIILMLFTKKPIQNKFKQEVETFWIEYPTKNINKDYFEKQY